MSELKGYICNIGDVIPAPSCSFFRAQFQIDKDNYEHLLCCSPDKRNTLKQYQDQGVALCLTNLRKTPSRRRLNFEDFVIQKDSKILKADVAFSAVNPPRVVTTLKDVEKCNLYSTVNIHAKLVSISDWDVVVVKGKDELKQDAIIADSTSTMKITLWGKYITVAQGFYYAFQDVIIKQFNDVRFLSLNRGSAILEIDPLLNTATPVLTDSHQSLVATVQGIVPITFFQCVSCKKTVNISKESKFVACDGCKTRQLKTSLRKKGLYKFTVQSENSEEVVVYSCFSSVFETFFKDDTDTADLTEDCKIEFLLENYCQDAKKLLLSVSPADNLITKITISEDAFCDS